VGIFAQETPWFNCPGFPFKKLFYSPPPPRICTPGTGAAVKFRMALTLSSVHGRKNRQECYFKLIDNQYATKKEDKLVV